MKKSKTGVLKNKSEVFQRVRKSDTDTLKKSEILKHQPNLKTEKTKKIEKTEKKNEKIGISRIKSSEIEKKMFEGLKIKKNIRNKSFVDYYFFIKNQFLNIFQKKKKDDGVENIIEKERSRTKEKEPHQINNFIIICNHCPSPK